MAADIQKPAFPKRSTIQNRPKLQAGTQVEVRSIEEGFQGSWHSGMVAGCENHFRVVEYHNLLGDSSEKLVESVEVTPMVDGNIPPIWRSSTNYRGLIRPLPPPVDIDKWGLPFGLCVDVFHNDAWWEGVIFDHNDGSEERLVFFPDIGDDLRAHFEMLRVTQDWDEATEDWTCRGNWVFLELIEEVEREWPLLVSVKQIWYELRIKKGFENLKEWTCQTKSIWKELVLGVVSDNFKLTLKEFFHKLNSSGLLEQEGLPLLELTEVALDSIIKPACDSLGCVPFGPNETNVEKVEEVFYRDDLGPPGFSKVLSDNLLSIGSNKKPEGVPSTTHRFGKLTQSTCREKIEWLPAGTDIVPGPEFCPYTIIAYIRQYKRGLDKFDLIKKVRKHLSYMGWKIEYSLYRKDQNKGTTRFRYTSPDGMIYYSLYTICGELSKAFSSEMIPSDDQRSLVSEKMLACKKTYRDSSPSEAHVMGPEYCPQDVKGVSHLHSDADALLSVHSNDKLCKGWYVCSSGINPELTLDAAPTDGLVSPTFMGKLQRCKMRKLERSQSNRPIVEPEYSLKAVEDYYRLYESKGKTDFRKLKRDVAVKKLQRKVKKHLAFVKWSIFYTDRGEKKRKVLKYRSPSGKQSYTLLGACKICLKEATIDDAHAYACRLRRQNVVSRENEGYGPLAIERQCSPVAESSGTSLSRELAEMGKAKEVGVRKLRFKRNNGVFSLDANWLQREKPSSFPPQENQGNELGTGSNSSGRVLRSSKRAREVANLTSSHQAPRTVLSWLIENNVVLPRAKVLYRSQTDGSTVAEGRVTRDGIKCNCCQSCFSLSNFEAHAGSTGRHPSANIFLEDGRSLLDCQKQLKRDISIKRSRSEPRGPRRLKVNRDHSKNDYICSVCHFGGELILCDQCPSSFHTYCLGLKEVPDGDWFCPSCCCGICDQSRFDRSTEHFTYRSGVHCEQCQRQYHVGCLKEKRHAKLESSPKGNWFCNTRCEEIFLGLHRLLGQPVPMGMNNLTWTLLKYAMSDSSDHNAPDTEELETCYPEELETYSKLNVALSVMHECFEPVKEPSTRRDLVEDVIFCRTSELNRLNFQGFYTVLLERNDELISVATVRIYGDKVAEVPLVATRFQYRRLGMCRVLMNELEKKLMELGVERLVLPAVPSVLHTWTTSFGFSVMTKSERLKFLDFTFLDFQGTFMCQKLLKCPSQESSMLRGTQLKLCDSANGTDVVDLDGSSAVSEVLQAERIEESAILDQGSSDMARNGGNKGVNGASPPLDVMVDQSTRMECQSEISMDCLFEAHNKEGDDNGNNLIFKCYKRRKLAAACGS